MFTNDYFCERDKIRNENVSKKICLMWCLLRKYIVFVLLNHMDQYWRVMATEIADFFGCVNGSVSILWPPLAKSPSKKSKRSKRT